MIKDRKERDFKKTVVPFIEILSKVISFFIIILLVRLVSIEDYADYAYTLNMVLWAALIMDGGVGTLIFNNCLQNDTDEINQLYSTRFFLSILVIVVLISLFFVLKNELFIIALLLSVSTYFTSTSYLMKMLARGLGYLKEDVTAILTEPILKLLVLGFVFFTKDFIQYDLVKILVLFLFISVFSYLYVLYVLRKLFHLKLYIHKTLQSFTIILKSLESSKYFLLYILVYIGIARMDIFFLEMNSIKSEVSKFSSAFSIYQTSQLFFFAVITSQFKVLFANNKILYRVVFPLVLLAILVVYFIAPHLYLFLFPKEYSGGEHILKNLIFALVPSVFNFYVITKNNYLKKVQLNFHLLSFLFSLKLLAYIIVKPDSGIKYTYGILAVEVLISCTFIAYILYTRFKTR